MRSHGTVLVEVSRLDVGTPAGRLLFRDLNLQLARDRVALIGRNGVGKTTLLEILAGRTARREVTLRTEPLLVAQDLGDAAASLRAVEERLEGIDLAEAGLARGLLASGGCSRGELRKLHLLAARHSRSELLLLDEPTDDLDEEGIAWLDGWLSRWRGGLLLASHSRRLLRRFEHFFVVSESGCRYVSGSWPEVERLLIEQDERRQEEYVRNLESLSRREEQGERVRNRHRRKKNRGRLRELRRCPSRARLNEKRGYAQVQQGKRIRLWDDRIAAARTWARATRRALQVDLPLLLEAPPMPEGHGTAIATFDEVSAVARGRTLFRRLSLDVRGGDRIAVRGPNGSGKTTLLSILLGRRPATTGSVRTDPARIGSIDQGATNWMSREGLVWHLASSIEEPSAEAVARILVGHRFPLALAERPLASLSPGERVRAALICLFHRARPVELLVLDEPTVGLDFVGLAAARQALEAWPGALVIVSHDREFVDSIGVDRDIRLGEGG